MFMIALKIKFCSKIKR